MHLKQDGAPKAYPDVSHIPDAEPYAELTSRGGNASSYVVNGVRYFTLKDRAGFSQSGIASWYGTKFHGRLTSNGERYDMYKMTAAHKTLPIPTYVRVTNLENNKSIMVRINDRGPFIDNRIIDLSYVAAIKLDMTKKGTARVRVEAWSADAANSVPPATPALATSTAGQQGIVKNSATVKLENELYYIQLGAFANHANAQNLVSKLLSITTEPVKMTTVQTDFGIMHRIRIGPYTDLQTISELEAYFRELGFEQQTRIVDNISRHAVPTSGSLNN